MSAFLKDHSELAKERDETFMDQANKAKGETLVVIAIYLGRIVGRFTRSWRNSGIQDVS